MNCKIQWKLYNNNIVWNSIRQSVALTLVTLHIIISGWGFSKIGFG